MTACTPPRWQEVAPPIIGGSKPAFVIPWSLFQQPRQVLRRNAQPFGGLRLVPIALFERLFNELLLVTLKERAHVAHSNRG